MNEVPANFDEEYYLSMNPDVEFAVRSGNFKSGRDHFIKCGHKENRSFAPAPITNELGAGIFPPYYFEYPYSSVGTLKPIIFSERSLSLPEDLKLVQRIKDVYDIARNERPDDFRIDKSGMWSVSMQRFERDLIQPMKNHELEKTVITLSEMFVTSLSFGLMSEGGNFIAQYAQKLFASVWADRLVRLAEALAIIEPRCIEQKADFYAPLDPDIDQLFGAICKKITGLQTINRPNVGKMYGIQVGTSIWHTRDLEHLLAVATIKSFSSNKNTSIMEIGGGYGGLVYWLYTAGFRNITLYDLPQMNILQNYFLSKSLPNARISLYGDSKTDLESAEIRILPYWHLDQVPSKSIGICVNQDSLPEIPKQIAMYYLKEIRRTTKDFFYSVNQEAQALNYEDGIQQSVPTLVDAVGGFERKIRTPFWCRQGYVQEIYTIT